MRVKQLLLVALLSLYSNYVRSQVNDTIPRDPAGNVLQEVSLRAYFRDQPILSSPASAAVISSKQLNNFSDASLVPAFNTVAGVRMEERSPGSYRLSIRGSLLRSPFGIRNVKIYLDEFALTDAGGNTYLNLADVSVLSRVEILKGPEGSVFGANTGGVILLSQVDKTGRDISASFNGGSYGLIHENLTLGLGNSRYRATASQAFQRADGYREHSSLTRKYYNLTQRYQYSPSSELRSVIFFSDLDYQTPGGLTLAQSAANRRAARLPAGRIPGAAEQQAGIFNKSIFGGILNETALSEKVRIVTALSGLHTDFKNPFITNFEVRGENSANLRAFADYSIVRSFGQLDLTAGLESQRTWSEISNYGNRTGARDTLQSASKLNAAQDFAFARLKLGIKRRLIIETAMSLNLYSYRYSNQFPKVVSDRKRRFDEQLMPRIAASWLVNRSLSVRASVSKGYSAPTIAEVRASDNVINTDLQPEKGWNYETGIRLSSSRIYIDASVFNFSLEQAIVRRLNVNDTEYFINAGGTRQRGIESSLTAWLMQPQKSGLVRSVEIAGSVAISRFSFKNYLNGALDYSGNKVTGVPDRTLTSSVAAGLPANMRLFIQHNYTSAIPLDDANTVFSKPFHNWQFRASAAMPVKGTKIKIAPFFGADNLFNARYSLGNDLNAAGGRYFNPSATRNLYAGIMITTN